eukprot:TRINITY_DN1606_c0_g1_i1.p1 TRINITY_DN1606_c0_g1~~TRINITY_DN1606_c0_g1_i1.p1  ORF type:complete len:58 (+),score=6.69 TRINITY_DN1606_c0_g1_i1:264-437(+)
MGVNVGVCSEYPLIPAKAAASPLESGEGTGEWVQFVTLSCRSSKIFCRVGRILITFE